MSLLHKRSDEIGALENQWYVLLHWKFNLKYSHLNKVFSPVCSSAIRSSKHKLTVLRKQPVHNSDVPVILQYDCVHVNVTSPDSWGLSLRLYSVQLVWLCDWPQQLRRQTTSTQSLDSDHFSLPTRPVSHVLRGGSRRHDGRKVRLSLATKVSNLLRPWPRPTMATDVY